MEPALADRIAIVTGASSGIGAAVALELARCGARVVLAARRKEQLEEQVERITGSGGHALAIPTDVGDPLQVANLIEQTKLTFGRVDILVNNAGVGWTRPLVSTSPAEIAQLIQTNLVGTILVTRAVLPLMLERRSGVVISVASVAGIVPIKPLYSATKFGVRGFSLSLRRQLIGSGIDICVVSPGPVRTSQTQGQTEKMSDPEFIARTIAQLARHPQREAIVPRKQLVVVWLEQIVPALADLAYHWRHRHDRRDWLSGPEPSSDGRAWLGG